MQIVSILPGFFFVVASFPGLFNYVFLSESIADGLCDETAFIANICCFIWGNDNDLLHDN